MDHRAKLLEHALIMISIHATLAKAAMTCTEIIAIREIDEALDYALACHIEWAIRAPIEDIRP